MPIRKIATLAFSFDPILGQTYIGTRDQLLYFNDNKRRYRGSKKRRKR